MNILDITKLIRIKQWYKNLVIFLPIIFGQQMTNLFALKLTIIGFFALCLISSANYILNDVFDLKKDRLNDEKRSRPIASGKINIGIAVILATIIFAISFYISLNISIIFSALLFLLFILSQLYTLALKKEPFADILLISTNFVIRTLSGAFIITQGINPYIEISPWLIICPFFLALFLAVSKRQSEVLFLKNKAEKHREVLKIYTKEITHALLIISTTLLIISYSLYVFFSPYPKLMFTLPFVIYIIFNLFYYAEKGIQIARHPEQIFRTFKLTIPILITLIIVFLAIYI